MGNTIYVANQYDTVNNTVIASGLDKPKILDTVSAGNNDCRGFQSAGYFNQIGYRL